MLWQLAYTEIFFEKKFWPDFNENDFSRILKNFRKINRKFGALNE
jgi:undecaprenyl diphosphate synthase